MMLITTMLIQYPIAKIDRLVVNRSFLSFSFSEVDLPNNFFLEKIKYVINASIFHMYLKKFLPSVTVETRPCSI